MEGKPSEQLLLCDSLVLWLQTFNTAASCRDIQDLTNGVAMAQVLHEIDAAWFDKAWLSRIKDDVGDNWRIKASNLKKVLQGITDYYHEFLGQQISEDLLPDLNRISEHSDTVELGRLLQLILGCAVNCEKKQEHIQVIMRLEESVQHVVMAAIQELMSKEIVGFVASDLPGDLDQQASKCEIHECIGASVSSLQEKGILSPSTIAPIITETNLESSSYCSVIPILQSNDLSISTDTQPCEIITALRKSIDENERNLEHKIRKVHRYEADLLTKLDALKKLVLNPETSRSSILTLMDEILEQREKRNELNIEIKHLKDSLVNLHINMQSKCQTKCSSSEDEKEEELEDQCDLSLQGHSGGKSRIPFQKKKPIQFKGKPKTSGKTLKVRSGKHITSTKGAKGAR